MVRARRRARRALRRLRVGGAGRARDAGGAGAGGWTCVAASAGYRRFQLPSLAHLGLLDCFDGLRFADDAGTLKRRLAFYGPIAPEVTHVACIGDSYVDDCLYPAQFGFATAWFTGARRSAPLRCGSAPLAHVERLDGVAGVLGTVAAGTRGATGRRPDRRVRRAAGRAPDPRRARCVAALPAAIARTGTEPAARSPLVC